MALSGLPFSSPSFLRVGGGSGEWTDGEWGRGGPQVGIGLGARTPRCIDVIKGRLAVSQWIGQLDAHEVALLALHSALTAPPPSLPGLAFNQHHLPRMLLLLLSHPFFSRTRHWQADACEHSPPWVKEEGGEKTMDV